jgi:hypothetical protein
MINPVLQQIVDRAFDRAEQRDRELAELAASAGLALALADLLTVWLRLTCRAAVAQLSEGKIARGDPAELDGPVSRFVAAWRGAPVTIDRPRVVSVAIDGVIENFAIGVDHTPFFRAAMQKMVRDATPDLVGGI